MRNKGALWFWRAVWVVAFLLWLGLVALYTWLPADGATGDLESFQPEGYRVQWLLERRERGLQVGDVIVRAGGHTFDEWLDGALRGPEWRSDGIVSYEILRDGQPMALEIQLAPVPFRAVLARWAIQLFVAFAFLVAGAFVFWSRPWELAARLLMFFCVAMTLQYWGDAYNFQYAILPWRWPFFFHLAFEHVIYGLVLSTTCYFALIFPAPSPWVKRFPRLVPFVLYTSSPVAIAGVMALSPNWSAALRASNRAAWIVAMIQLAVAFGAGIHSARTARDPVTRAQIRWIIWCAAIGSAVLLPSYVLPIMLTGRPLLPHPATMIFVALIPLCLVVAVLRYHLFDIEIIVNRTLVYGTLTLFLGGLYLILVRLLTLVVQKVLHRQNDTLVVFVATLSIALAFAPLRRRVQGFIDRTFYQTKLDFQRLLPEMSERLSTSMVLDQLNELLAVEIPERLQLAWATLSVLDPEGEQLVPAVDDGRPSLAVNHPLLEYLRSQRRSLIRLQPPPHLPEEARAFLDEHAVELSIPLIVGEQLVGLYNLGRKLSGDPYGRDEVRLLHLLGQQAAAAVQNSRLFQATKRQAEELAGLHDAAVAISSSLEVEEVLSTLAEQLGRALAVSSAYICDLDETTFQTTVLAEWIGPEAMDRDSDLGAVYDLRDYPTALRHLTAKQPLTLQATDPDLDASDRASAERFGWHSILIIPLLVRERVIGYAELWESRWERKFTEAEVRLCQTLAADAAAAIEQARLFQAEREQRRLAEALQKAADVVSSTLDLDQVLDRILEQVEQVVVGDAFNIMLLQGYVARVVRWRGYTRLGVADRMASLAMSTAKYSTLAKMIQTGKPLYIPDTAVDLDWVPRDGWETVRSYLSTPIRVAGRIVGFLNVDGIRPGQFGPADVQRLEAFAHHAATALENARLYAETQRQLREQTALREAGAVISSTLNRETVLTRIAEQMGQVIDVTSAYISSYDPATMLATVIAEYISPQACAAERESDLGQAYQEDAEIHWLERMQAGKHDVSHIDDPDLADSEFEHMRQYGAISILYIPLRVKGELVGYAELWESRRRREFTPEEIALCQDIAQQAAIALEHARLYEQAQQEIAERKRAEAQIKASLEEKEVLLKEIHHRVKNNLQVISSLLYLQSKRIRDEKTLAMFQESQHRVRSMALVHERFYQTEDLARVDAADYIRTLASYLFRSYGVKSGRIRLSVHVDDISLGIDTAIPCGLIINELVSNSLKHAFPNGQAGLAFVELHATRDSRYTLVVGDDGVGFPRDLDFRRSESLGLQLVTTLVRQLEGEIELDQSDGTRFEIVFANPG